MTHDRDDSGKDAAKDLGAEKTLFKPAVGYWAGKLRECVRFADGSEVARDRMSMAADLLESLQAKLAAAEETVKARDWALEDAQAEMAAAEAETMRAVEAALDSELESLRAHFTGAAEAYEKFGEEVEAAQCRVAASTVRDWNRARTTTPPTSPGEGSEKK